jgi:hypothetical protein
MRAGALSGELIMTRRTIRRTSLSNGFAVASFILVAGSMPPAARAEEKVSEPVYRVAADATATQTPAVPAAVATPAPATTEKAPTPLDFTRQGEEHELAPVIRVLKTTQEEVERSIRDYSCTLVKTERVDGELGETQYIFMKIMHEPFSVYMSFLKPFAGREVCYVNGQNNGEMVVLEAGWKRLAGKMNLDPKGALAMKGQKHPITDVGMLNLTSKLKKIWEAEMQFAECNVTTNAETTINRRPTVMVRVTHPKPRQNFRWNEARLFFDKELRLPIHFDAYTWPAQEGGEPVLEESYTYTNLKINNSFTARDFDANNNPDIFKK